MKMLASGVLAFVCGATLSLGQQASSPDGMWRAASEIRATSSTAAAWTGVLSYRVFELEQIVLQNTLAVAPAEAGTRAADSPAVITLPMPDGTFQRFAFVDSPVMAPELAAKYPEIRTYLGQGLDDPHATVRFDWSPSGFHGFVRSPSGTAIIDPYVRGQTELYASYYRHDISPEAAAWTCYTDDLSSPLADMPIGVLGSSGSDLRVYRVAVATTGEYTQFHGGTVAQGLAAVTTAINRITGIFEQEFCIRLQLVANNNLIIYTDASTDPYTGNDNSTMLDQNQTNLDNVIGSLNYDIGHVFTTAGGGVTFPGIACMSGWKGKGASGRGSPIGDAFVVEIAAHEMGHQVGSHHTWNGTLGSCTSGQWGAETACEPGSGTTIMGYPGLCGADNTQSSRDYYYHAISYEKIRNYIVSGTGKSCPTVVATSNNPPTVNAGSDYTIPKETPFVLTASGGDPNGDPITYCWEEMDLGPQAALSAGDNGSSPIFRSWPPTTSSSRTFPRLSDLLNNTLATGELLPTTGRTLKMRCTVRDNRAGGGGVNSDDVVLTVAASAGPFTVTSPNTTVTWSGTRTVTWNVANTNASPVNCSQVNIRLSIDGGNTYPYLLAASTPNDGSQSVTLPDTPTTQARIKVEAVGNIFFDISDVNFTIPCPTPDVATNVNATDGSYPYVYITWTLPVGDPVGLSHCQIWRNTTNNSGTAMLIEDNWTTTGYQDASTTPYATYYYWIKMVNLCGGVSAFSASDSGWRVLGPPANVTATDGSYTNKVRVAWDAGGGTHYRVYRNTTNNSVTATAMTSWITSLLWDDATASPGSLYYYWVQAAMSSAGAQPSDFSAYNTGWRALTPPIVQASKGTSAEHVLVQWNSPTGATHYCVYRGVSSNLSQATSLTGWITGNSYADTTPPAGVSYYYWVKAAVSSSGLRETSLAISDVGWKAYMPPANVSATDGTDDTRILITWDASPMATYYRVYRSATNDPATALAQGSWQTATSYSDYTAYCVDFYYWIKAAASSSGEKPSDFSAGDVGWRALPPPTNTDATDGASTDSVRITWNLSPVSGCYYRVYRGSTFNPKLSSPLGDWTYEATSFDDTTATPGLTYYYWVRGAMNPQGTRDSVSNSDTGWRALSGPTATASDGTSVAHVAVSWSAVEGASYYRVYRSATSGSGTAVPLSSWRTNTSYYDTSATPGRTYYYWITAAVDSSGTHESAFGRGNSGWRAQDCNGNGVPDQNEPDKDGDGVIDACDQCLGTPPATPVDGRGCPFVPPDFDRDGDVDLVDFVVFQGCFNGPNRSYAATNCERADFDADTDVDLVDFKVFQNCFNGPNRPPTCP